MSINIGLIKAWGGYIIAPGRGTYDEAQSIAYAQQIVDALHALGYTGIRYQSIPSWLTTDTNHRIKYAVVDALIARAATYGMVVILDNIHNFSDPQSISSGIMRTNFNNWRGLLEYLGYYFNGRPNVVVECVNEYVYKDCLGSTGFFQKIVDSLRQGNPTKTTTYPDGRPPCTLPLHFNFMWTDAADGTSIGQLQWIPVDKVLQGGTLVPAIPSKISTGHHHYGDKITSDTDMNADELWEAYVARIGLTSGSMNTIFNKPTDPTYYAYAKARGIQVMCTEVGPHSTTGSYSLYTRGRIAYDREFVRQAEINQVGVVCFRTGDYEDMSEIRTRSQNFFNLSFEPWNVTPIPTTFTLQIILTHNIGTPVWYPAAIYVNGQLVGNDYFSGDIEAGQCTISYGPVNGYIAPPTEVIQGTAGVPVTITRNYTVQPPLTGHLVVNAVDENGQLFDQGPILFNGLLAGMGYYEADLEPQGFTITFGKVSGVIAPDPVTDEIIAGQSTVIIRTYVLQPIPPVNRVPMLIGASAGIGIGLVLGDKVGATVGGIAGAFLGGALGAGIGKGITTPVRQSLSPSFTKTVCPICGTTLIGSTKCPVCFRTVVQRRG